MVIGHTVQSGKHNAGDRTKIKLWTAEQVMEFIWTAGNRIATYDVFSGSVGVLTGY
jgi:hypothetical protein